MYVLRIFGFYYNKRVDVFFRFQKDIMYLRPSIYMDHSLHKLLHHVLTLDDVCVGPSHGKNVWCNPGVNSDEGHRQDYPTTNMTA